LKKTFDAVTWMRRRRAKIDEEDQGLSWEEKRQKTRDFLEKDPLKKVITERRKYLVLPLCLMVFLYFITIFFGGAHIWTQSTLILAVLALILAGLWIWLLKKAKSSAHHILVIFDSISLIGILFLIWVAFQQIPLPPKYLQTLSPHTNAIWESTVTLGAEPPFPISLYPYMTLNSFLFVLTILLFYLLALYGIKRRKQVHEIIFGLLVLGTLISLYALLQLAAGQEYILWWEKAVSLKVATGTFIDRNHLAGFLSMLICLGIGYIWAVGGEGGHHFRGRRSWSIRIEEWAKSIGVRRTILLLAVALMMATLLATASRGGALSLLAGIIFMVGLILARFIKKRNAFILILMLSVACMYVSYVAIERVMERFQHFKPDFLERIAITRDTYEMGKDFPHTGTGLGTFEFVFPMYQKTNIDTLLDYAHNDWMQLFAETGWVGVLIIGGGFIWLMGSSVAIWRRRHDPFSVGIGLGGMGAVVSIAIHSLTEFNLHMPANDLVLALILALLYIALHSEIHRGEERFSYKKKLLNFPFWIGIPTVIIATLGAGVMAKQVVKVWRADSLARTVWNSTAPFVPPTDQALKKAWSLAPGNATYWAWLAHRISGRAGDSLEPQNNEENVPRDLDIYLLGKGIHRNPTAWPIWRNLGWAAFFKLNKDPHYYFPIAQKAFDQARRLRPYAPQGHLEFGIVELFANAQNMKGKEGDSWREPFQRASSLNPDCLLKVMDQLIFYLGREGVKEVRGLLLEDSRGYLLASDYLLKQGFLENGMEILEEGEAKREWDVKKLWTTFKKGLPIEERNKIVDQILSLDPQHPGSLFVRGRIVEALKSQEQRGGLFEELGSLREIAWSLYTIDKQKKGLPVEIAYFLGRVAEEEGNFGEARMQFQRALNFNPQYFPAWVHLQEILSKKARTVEDQIELESLGRKIKLFEMDRVVADAWNWGGISDGSAFWAAPFRVAQAQKGMEIKFSVNLQGAWKLILDGRFVTSWTGSFWHEIKTFPFPAGEHIFRLVQYQNISPGERKKPPFTLEIQFFNYSERHR
jgi:putative inorganic carbon (HCO3(-)) transporter